MKLKIEKIKEIKVVKVDVKGSFVYIDQLSDGSWRLVYTADLKDDLIIEERNEQM